MVWPGSVRCVRSVLVPTTARFVSHAFKTWMDGYHRSVRMHARPKGPLFRGQMGVSTESDHVLPSAEISLGGMLTDTFCDDESLKRNPCK
eukprot:scaffold2203_cov176-Amphora_coffeaeformis.AAC.5